MSGVVVAIVGYRCATDILECVERLNESNYKNIFVHICENGGILSFGELKAGFCANADFVQADKPAPGRSRIVETCEFQSRRGNRAVREVILHRASDNLGFAGAINEVLLAVRNRPDWTAVWVLNPDTEPRADALDEMMKHAVHGDYGIVGARLVVKGSGRVQLYGGRWRRWLGRGFNIGLGRDPEASVDVAAIEREQNYVAGASMLVSRRFIETIGLMQEDYFLYGEEIDWCLRRGPFRLGYAHNAVVVHAHGASIGSSTDRRQKSALSVYFDERARLLLSRRHYPMIYPVITMTTLLMTLQYLKAGAIRNFRFALLGWWAGLLGQTGFPDKVRRLLEPAPEPGLRTDPARAEGL